MDGIKDGISTRPDGGRALPPRIDGVVIRELGNILTRSGWMSEVFRSDWGLAGEGVHQVNYVCLAPQAVTDWHRHLRQTDRLLAVGGNVKLVLWDTRDGSPTKGQTELVRMGALRPVLVVVPPGVWHALRNESGEPAGYLNVTDTLYAHADPDNWRLPAGATGVPPIL